MNDNDLQNNQSNHDDQLTDLEPINEVKGGSGGTGVLTLGGTNTYMGVTERTSGLIYSGESGGINE